jgi:hypothetical protein
MTIHKDVLVWFDNKVVEKIPSLFVVGSKGLNDKDGILGVWMDDESIIHIFAGDDGKWYEVYHFHRQWFDEILYVLEAFHASIRNK